MYVCEGERDRGRERVREERERERERGEGGRHQSKGVSREGVGMVGTQKRE